VQFRLRSKTYDSLLRAAGSGAVPERQLREAETGVSESRIRLLSARQALINLGFAVGEELKELPEDQLAAQIQFLGIPQPLLERLDSSRRTGNLIAIKTPLEGVVVTREVVAGEIVDSAKALFMVADPRRMWLSLHVKMEDAKYLALGQAVRFRSDASAADVAGTISWISPAVDERTRTVKVRAELANQNGRLLANTFGSGRIILREEKYAVVVPKEAVHWDGDCQVVFVRDKNYLDEKSPKVFHVRKVRTGAQDEHYIEILAGLLPGEVIAVKGSAVLQAELLKSQLGES
jgi:cobalt-zinc-cadmium efflux system membrane fusion protein